MDCSCSPPSPGSSHRKTLQEPHASTVGMMPPGPSSPLRNSMSTLSPAPVSPTEPGTGPVVRDVPSPPPLDLLVRGEEQTIEIPMSLVLEKVMRALPAKKSPIFNWVGSGPDSFQVCVEIDCTGVRIRRVPRVNVARVLGYVCGSPHSAHLSAVMKSFEYLEKMHFIRVTDYISEEAKNYQDKRVFGDVNECSYTIEKVLSEWGSVLSVISKFRSEIQRLEMNESVDGVMSAAGGVYSETRNFATSVITKYLEKHRIAYLEFRQYEAERMQYLKDSNEKTNAYILKAYKQFVHFSAKDVLDYVVQFMGLKGTEYSNEVLPRSGLFIGEVSFWLPEIEEAGCGGRTKFRGIELFSAASAEESAAAKALHYLEEKLKVTVIDKNYDEKVCAKEKHKTITKILAKFVKLGEDISREWSYMLEYIHAGVDIFGVDEHGYGCQTHTAAEVAAMKFCADGISKLHDDCVKPYEPVAEKIKNMEKFRRVINNLDD